MRSTWKLRNVNHFRHPTDEQLRQLDIYRSCTSDRGLSSLKCFFAPKIYPLTHIPGSETSWPFATYVACACLCNFVARGRYLNKSRIKKRSTCSKSITKAILKILSDQCAYAFCQKWVIFFIIFIMPVPRLWVVSLSLSLSCLMRKKIVRKKWLHKILGARGDFTWPFFPHDFLSLRQTKRKEGLELIFFCAFVSYTAPVKYMFSFNSLYRF